MAARRSWCVLVDDHRQVFQDDTYAGKYNPTQPDILSVFFRESQANDFAIQIANKYPGKDVHVFKQSYGYSSQPTTPIVKEWTEDGHFLPPT